MYFQSSHGGQICEGEQRMCKLQMFSHSPCLKVTMRIKSMGHIRQIMQRLHLQIQLFTSVANGRERGFFNWMDLKRRNDIEFAKQEFLLLWTNNWIMRRVITYLWASGWLVNTLMQWKETHCTAFPEQLVCCEGPILACSLLSAVPFYSFYKISVRNLDSCGRTQKNTENVEAEEFKWNNG